MKTIQLVLAHGNFCLADGPNGPNPLVYYYHAGDCDFCNKPDYRLARAIFDAVETGDIEQNHGEFKILLPDGTPFNYLEQVK